MNIQVFFDYTCPFCYLALSYLDQLLPQFPTLEIEGYPCEAHPDPEPEIQFSVEARFWQKGVLPAAKEGGIPIGTIFQPMPRSLKAMEGLYFLKEVGGNLSHYNKELFRKVFVTGENIGDPSLLVEVLVAAGADPTQAAEALASGRYTAQVKAGNQFAYQQSSVEVLPTFIAGEQRLEAALGVGITYQALEEFLQSLVTN